MNENKTSDIEVEDNKGHSPVSKISEGPFGNTSAGDNINCYTLKNKNGMSVTFINFGATVVKIEVPDKTGKTADVILGYDDAAGYEAGSIFLGGIIGRFGNRLKNGRLTIDGNHYQSTLNDGNNSLHGGVAGFHKRVWLAELLKDREVPSIKFSYVSPDGEEGFPGKLNVEVIYSVTDDNELVINYKAVTDKPTVINMTSHCYFNLSGDTDKNILDHELTIHADKYTPIDAESIPTGVLQNVSGTPMDFRRPSKIGKNINADDVQLKNGKGYDHNWVLNNYGSGVRSCAVLYDPVSGREMEVLTDQPGLQFYSGNFLDGSFPGKYGKRYNFRTALCLETQNFPDAPNHPDFPNAVLRPGEVYNQKTIYKFSVR